jgi:hypothetical protein
MSATDTPRKRFARLLLALCGFLVFGFCAVALYVNTSAAAPRISFIASPLLGVVAAAFGAAWVWMSITSLPAFVRSIRTPAPSPLRRIANVLLGLAGIILGVGFWLGFLLLNRIATFH